MTLVSVGAAGFIGAIARYLVDAWIGERFGRDLPFGTFTVNITGALMLGLFVGFTAERVPVAEELRAPIAVGFIGTYTTFSTYLLDSWLHVERGGWLIGIANLVGSVVLGLVALRIGLLVGRGA
jgi:CrcB protein